MRTIEQPFLRAIPSGTVWFSDVARVGLMTGIVKVAGAVKTALSARVFGLGDALDAYFVAFSLCSFLCDSLAGSLSPALVPLFVRSEETGSRKETCARYGGTLYSSVLLLSTVGAVLLAGREVLLRLLAPGFSPQELSVTRSLLLVLAPMFPLMGINAVWRSLLNSQGLFVLTAIAPVMTPLLAIGFLLFAHTLGGVYTLALGSTTGVLAETLILALYLWRLQIPILPSWKGSLTNVLWFRRAYAPLVFSNFLQGGINVVDQSVATLLAPGSVSTLTLGTRVVSVVMAIGPTTLSTVILPKLCRIASMKDWEIMRSTVKRWLLVSFGAACLLSSVAILFSGPLAHLAFQSGSSNTMRMNTLKNVQSLSFLQLPFVVGKIILVRVIVALELNNRLVSISVLALVVNAVLDLCFVRLFGIGGITVSTAVVQAVTFLALLSVLRNLFATQAVLSRAA